MADLSQDNYQHQETSQRSSSCICCSCNEERELMTVRRRSGRPPERAAELIKKKDIHKRHQMLMAKLKMIYKIHEVTSQSNNAIHRRCWESNSPPQPPDAWRETFDHLLRQWADHTQKGGREDHIQPYYPTPGDVRLMFGQSNINGVPEYATGHTLRDPQEWRPDAYQAPSINQQAEEWARWERATLHVSVKSFDPVTGSHFSMGSTWNPGATPVINNNTSNTRNTALQFESETSELDTKRAYVESLLRRSSLSTDEKQDVISAFLNNTVLNPSDRVEATTAMLRRSTATYDEKKRTLFSALKANADKLDTKRDIARAVINALVPDSNTRSSTFIQIFSNARNENPELESDYCSQIMNDLTVLTKGRVITNDETRADIESLVRTSPLNTREKAKVIDRLLKENILDPLRKTYVESMIRRCVMSNDERRANIISILQNAEIAPSSKAEVIAIILEEDSKSGNVFDVENMINEVVSGKAILDAGYNISVQDSEHHIRDGTPDTKYGKAESVRSMRDPVSNVSVKPNRSQMEKSQTSAMNNSGIPPHLLESSTTQRQTSGQLYSTTNINQPSKYSNLDTQGQRPSQMYRSQRDLKGDVSKTTYTPNAESVGSMRDEMSKTRFKPSQSQMERSHTSSMNNSGIPPHLLESSTTQRQTSGQLYSTSNMNQPSKYSNLDIQGQRPSQMYRSQRDLKGDISKTTYTDNAESIRSMRDEVSKTGMKPSHSQMRRSQASSMDNSGIPPHLLESSTTQRQTSGQLYSTTNMNQPSKYSTLDIQEQSPSQMYRSQRDLKGDVSKTAYTGNVESRRSTRDEISKTRFKPSYSQMDRSQTSAMNNSNIPPHLFDSFSSRDQISGEQYSSNKNQISNEKIQEVQGQSVSQMSKEDMKDNVSKTTFGGIMESFRSIRDHVSNAYLKPSQSQNKSQPPSTDNINQSSKYSNLNYQGQSTSQRNIKGDVSKTTYKGNAESLQSIKEQESKGSFRPSHSQIDSGEIVESRTSPSLISEYKPVDEIRSSVSLTSADQIVDLEAQAQDLPKKSLLCAKCNYIKTCGCCKLSDN